MVVLLSSACRRCLPLPEAFDILWRQLRSVDRQRELLQLAGELERDLVILVVHRCAGVGTDVEVLIPLHDEWDSELHGLPRHFFAIDLEHARTTATDTARVVIGERAHPETGILELELQRVPAWR